ncbi:MAG: hypothetical protein HZA53_00050, partial [Planctomycetes bacterium]|nr:hypothetical protein [Planctomycetota bacterium]
NAAVVGLLGEAVGRDVVRLAFVVDGDEARGKALQAGLEKLGMFVSRWDSGAKALAMVRRAGGLDVLLASDKQKDITLAEIIDEMKDANGGLANVPVVVVADTAEAAQLYGDRIQGSVQSPENLDAVTQALSKELDGDRALADDLARRAGEVLAHLAHGGHDISATLGALQGVLENRKDEVVLPAMGALGAAGGATHVSALVDVLANEARSEAVRVGAAEAVAGILGRNASAVGAEGAAKLQAVAGSTAPVAVRDAAARALGRMEMDAAARVEFLRKLRAGSTGSPAN